MLGDLATEATVLGVHVLLKRIALRSVRHSRSAPRHVSMVFPLPLRRIDAELLFWKFHCFSEVISEESRAGSIHDYDATGLLFIHDAEELG
jgi:hypothetical protein